MNEESPAEPVASATTETTETKQTDKDKPVKEEQVKGIKIVCLLLPEPLIILFMMQFKIQVVNYRYKKTQYINIKPQTLQQ